MGILVLVFGMMVVGGDSATTENAVPDPALNGTWLDLNKMWGLRLNNGNWTAVRFNTETNALENDYDDGMGTFTNTSNTIAFRLTHINFTDNRDRWLTREQNRANAIALGVDANEVDFWLDIYFRPWTVDFELLHNSLVMTFPPWARTLYGDPKRTFTKMN